MADFDIAFERMITAEGGYELHTVPGDTGGMTYAGISRNNWPNWPGWEIIDSGETPEQEFVSKFYIETFWDKIRGDQILFQGVADSIFDFAVNAGIKTAIKIAQKIYRYKDICLTDRRRCMDRVGSNLKFLCGWINRVQNNV